MAQPASQPASQRAPAILPESNDWTLDEALSRLKSADATDDVRRSAAVRLARLSKTPIACLPEDSTDDWLRGLAVLDLAANRWTFGIARDQPRQLGMPVLLRGDGRVQSLAPESEEEASTIIVSDDAEVFPHLLITPLRVVIVGEELHAALVAKSLNGARFEYRRKEGKWPYVAMLFSPRASSAPATQEAASQKSEPIEVAQYRWDPDEGAFIGPERDRLPGTESVQFVLDLRESKLLIPVGGEIPEPEPEPAPANPPVPRDRPFDRPPD